MFGCSSLRIPQISTTTACQRFVDQNFSFFKLELSSESQNWYFHTFLLFQSVYMTIWFYLLKVFSLRFRITIMCLKLNNTTWRHLLTKTKEIKSMKTCYWTTRNSLGFILVSPYASFVLPEDTQANFVGCSFAHPVKPVADVHMNDSRQYCTVHVTCRFYQKENHSAFVCDPVHEISQLINIHVVDKSGY